MKNFSNHFLISMPHMNDSFFEKSLIYICNHNEEGAMGLIINKIMPSHNAQDILIQTGLNQINPYPEIYLGGPVGIENGLILHDSSYKLEGELRITSKIKLTSNKKIIDDIINSKGPQDYLFLFGYAGWHKKQLEQEIENGDWLIMPANYEFIFKTPNHLKWSNAAIQFGIDINSFSGGKSGRA